MTTPTFSNEYRYDTPMSQSVRAQHPGAVCRYSCETLRYRVSAPLLDRPSAYRTLAEGDTPEDAWNRAFDALRSE